MTSSERSGHSLALIHALGWCAVVHAEIGDSDRADRVLADIVKSIFRKLGVAARPDAVSRARELRLL